MRNATSTTRMTKRIHFVLPPKKCRRRDSGLAVLSLGVVAFVPIESSICFWTDLSFFPNGAWPSHSAASINLQFDSSSGRGLYPYCHQSIPMIGMEDNHPKG